MNIIEFFESDELELPRSWETYPGSFDEYISQIYADYLKVFRQITPFPYGYLSARIAQEYTSAFTLCDAIQRSIREYFLGHPPRAYKPLADALGIARAHFQAMFSIHDISNVISHLYRIRGNKPPVPTSAQDMFHVPFQERHKVASYRYSILGLPSLYLGSTVYACWEEYGRPPIDSLYLARFKPISGATFQVLDFGWRPAWFAGLIRSGTHAKDLSGPSRLSDLITAQAVCWPLLAASSIKVRNTGEPFKPEYVVPQLILQWLTTETTLDGVRYFSTKVENYFSSPSPASNFVFPARSSKPSGYCDHLASKFQLTDPVHWPSVCAAAPTINTVPYTNFDIEYPHGTNVEVPYLQTDLGKFQLHAASNSLCRV